MRLLRGHQDQVYTFMQSVKTSSGPSHLRPMADQQAPGMHQMPESHCCRSGLHTPARWF